MLFFLHQHLQSLCWIPSDINPTAKESIIAWKNISDVNNLALPLTVDVTQDTWHRQVEDKKIDGIVNINMIHISPWNACLGLLQGAGKILPAGGILYLYGPFKRNGEHTSKSNAIFDASLSDRNSAWGVRDLEEGDRSSSYRQSKTKRGYRNARQ